MGRQILDPDAEEGAKVLMDQEKIWTHFQGAGIRSFDLAEPRYDALARSSFAEYQARLNWNVAGRTVKQLIEGVVRRFSPFT